jgi:hypothetical protein
MNGQYLISSPIKSSVRAINKPTQFTSGTDSTARTVELDKRIQQPVTSRETSSSITLGGM